MPIALDANALYFQALENGNRFATFEERVIGPDFEANFGFRAKLSGQLPHDCWQLGAQFLHYHSRTWTGDVHMWRLHMGIGDLLLERSFPISSCFSWTPTWGVRYAMVRKKTYLGSTTNMKNKYWGVGPVIGLEGLWQICDWLGIFARSGYSLLYGSLYLHQDIEELKLYDEATEEKNISEIAAGLRLSKGGFYGQVAFEVFWLPGQNQLYKDLITNQGDLSLHGVSFGLGFNF